MKSSRISKINKPVGKKPLSAKRNVNKDRQNPETPIDENTRGYSRARMSKGLPVDDTLEFRRGPTAKTAPRARAR